MLDMLEIAWNDVLSNLIQTGLTASAAALVLLLLRRVMKKRYPARAVCIVWAILAIRLLIPVQLTLPDAPLQVTPRTTYLSNVTLDAAAIEQAELPVYEQAGAVTTQHWVTNGEVQALREAAGGPGSFSVFDLGQVLCVLWIAGAVAFAVWQWHSYRSFVCVLKNSSHPAERDTLRREFEEQKQSLGIRRDIPLRVTPAADCPLLAGFLKPALYLPDEALSAGEAGFIFRHELTHYKRGDLWLKLLLTAARSVHWFNPLVHLLARFAQEDIELACDDAVVRGMDVDDRRAYGETILRSAAAQAKRRALVSCFTGDKQTLMRRFEGIFDTRTKKRGAALIVAAALLVGTLGCAVSVGESEPPAVSETALEGNVYTNATYGYTLTLPDCFADRAYANAWEYGSVTFGLPDALPGYTDDPTDGGVVMTLQVEATAYLRELFGEDWQAEYMIPCKELVERDGLTWYLAFASDVQYDPSNPEITAAYTEMYQAAQAMDGSALSFEGQTGDQQENERALLLRALARVYAAQNDSTAELIRDEVTIQPEVADNAALVVIRFFVPAGDYFFTMVERVWYDRTDTTTPSRTETLVNTSDGVRSLEAFRYAFPLEQGLPVFDEAGLESLSEMAAEPASLENPDLSTPEACAEYVLHFVGGEWTRRTGSEDDSEMGLTYRWDDGEMTIRMQRVQLSESSPVLWLPFGYDGAQPQYPPYLLVLARMMDYYPYRSTVELLQALDMGWADGAYAESILAELDQRWQQDADAVEDAVAGTGAQTVWAQHKAANPDIFGARFSDSEIEAACQAVRDYAGAHGFSVENLHYDADHDFTFSQGIMTGGVLQDNVENDGLTIENVITVMGDAQFDDDAWREQAEGWSFTLYRGADGKWVLEDGAYGY